MQELCPICGLEVYGSEVAHELKAYPALVNYIKIQHPQWGIEHKICRDCLELFKSEFNNQRDTPHNTDEPTLIYENDVAINKEDADTASLVIIHGVNLGKRFEIRNKEFIIGRSTQADVPINEENISRKHARIYKKNKIFIIEDLGSTNGTFVNTKKVEVRELIDGDLILVGNTLLKFISGSNFENKYHEELYRLATVDGLTQICNKKYFHERLKEEFNRARRYKRSLSFMLLDLDHFHNLNTAYGHLAGDFVLKNIAQLVSKNLRKEDAFGRYGGEEFGILLPEIELSNSLFLAEKMRKIIETGPFKFDGKNILVTASIGVATMNAEMTNPDQLIKAADDALYKAKSEGRNCVRT
jgi:two-component system cell cycle response regulator